ncbi:unnamed protein product, partial [Rotaria sp. Silwood1]
MTTNPDIVRWDSFVYNDWGNALSPYWQARGVAFLWGSSFSLTRWNTPAWIGYLPISVEP